MRRFVVFEILLLLSAIPILFYTAFRDISTATDHIPTILNGLTSSISVIVAFTGILITFGLTGTLYKFSEREKNKRVMLTLVSLGLPLALLWTAYSNLLDDNYYWAVKVAMIGLLLASVIFIDFIGFLSTRTTPSSQETVDKQAKISESAACLRPSKLSMLQRGWMR